MKKILAILFIITSIYVNAQTGIGTTTPNASAKLDVYSDNKGFLPPRVTLTSATDNTTIATPAEGLLVYNKGSVGLQAGYYYWNGANWATIATATSAGNGVTASDMVKIYDGIGNATINSTGATFSVTTSGKYSFDFTTSAFSTIGSFTLNFQVRDGANSNAVIGSDMQTSYNNNVRTEYNGKVEVNLIAGRSYNVLITATSGTINSGDYCRVYMKQVAGNLPVTGQTVDYVYVTRTGTDQTVNTNDIIKFNTINGGNIPYNTTTGLFSLTAGKTYKLTGSVSLSNGNSVAKEINVVWKNATGDVLGSKGEMLSPSAAVDASGNGTAFAIYTPVSNTTVALYVNYSSASTIVWQNFTFASIEQIGSSAIVNPWVLSGNDVYNTTGEVGIGTNAPDVSAILDINSSSKGLLPPRVALTGKSGTSTPIASPATGLIVYNTATAGTADNKVIPGFYYFNGTIWTRMDNDGWSSPSTISISAVTTAPTKGTVVYDKVRYRRTSETSYEVTYNYAQSTPGTSGSGDYLFSLPSGLSFGNSVLTTNSSIYETVINRAIIGNGILGVTDGSRFRAIAIVPYDATRFRLVVTGADNSGQIIDSATLGLNFDGASYKFSFILDTN